MTSESTRAKSEGPEGRARKAPSKQLKKSAGTKAKVAPAKAHRLSKNVKVGKVAKKPHRKAAKAFVRSVGYEASGRVAQAHPEVVVAQTPPTEVPIVLFQLGSLDLVSVIRKGVPAASVIEICANLEMPREKLYSSLGMPRSTVEKKIKDHQRLSSEQSEKVIGLQRLVGLVESMVTESGEPKSFDAYKWVGDWLQLPNPALGGERPASYMDTMHGQELISRLLARSQSGAYS